MSKPRFWIIDIEGGYDWEDILAELEIPHYSNDHSYGDKPPIITQQRRILCPDPIQGGEIDTFDLLVCWEEGGQPTDEQIIERIKEDFV